MRIMTLLYIFGGLLFLASFIGHLYVRIRLRPRNDPELDGYYHEVEDLHPGYARYTRWLRITLGGAALGMALLFLVYVL
jgi:hypothetical protein